MVCATALVQLNRTVPLLWIKLPPVKAALSLNSRVADGAVKLVPDKVNIPLIVKFPAPPAKLPSPKLAAEFIVMVLVFWVMVPVYPALMVMLYTVTAASIEQFPTR